MVSTTPLDTFYRKLSDLQSATREDLIERWIAAHGCEPPKGIKRELLVLSASWHIQAKWFGGFPPEIKANLRKLVGSRTPAKSTPTFVSDQYTNSSKRLKTLCKPHLPLLTGTRLVREWNGKVHIVEVTDFGFLHDGDNYRSLSAVAKRITNAHWSGPRFFGL